MPRKLQGIPLKNYILITQSPDHLINANQRRREFDSDKDRLSIPRRSSSSLI